MEASCLQLSFFARNCSWSVLLAVRAFFAHNWKPFACNGNVCLSTSKQTVNHSPRNSYKLIPLPVFFCIFFFFCNFTGIRCGHRFFCKKSSNQNQLTSPDRCGVFCFFGGGGLENIFCNFYEINCSQDFFCIAKVLVLMVSKEAPLRAKKLQL